MERLAKKHHLESQANEHLIIGKLLKKQRSPEKQKQVQAVLGENIPLNKKIKKIQELDTPGEPAKMHRQSLPEQKTEEQDVMRNRRKLKKRLEPEKFFSFLFHHYSRIKKFGEETHIISTGFFPFSLKMNNNLKINFRDYFQKRYVPPLVRSLNHILKVGWKYLTKKEYNLLVIMKRLGLALMNVDFMALDFKDKHLIDRISGLENHFFMLYYKPHYMDLIIRSGQTVLAEDERFRKEYAEFPVMIKRLLLPDVTLPSLYNFLLGANMFKLKKYIQFREMVNYNNGSIINGETFECDGDIQEKINLFVTEEEKLLAPIFIRLTELKRLKAFLPPEKEKNWDFSLLEGFYNNKAANPPLNFNKDTDNIMVFMTNLCLRYGDVFKELLNGQITIDRVGKVEIFTSRFFSFDFNKLQHHAEKLEKLSFSLPNFTRSRFFDLKVSPRNAITVEVEVLQQINEITTILVEIGKKLSDVILNRQLTQKDVVNNVILDPVILTGKTFCIPYENFTIEDETLLHGRTVVDALSFATCVSLLCGVFFRNAGITDLLQNEKKIYKAIEEKKELLHRLADPGKYQSIRHKYKGFL